MWLRGEANGREVFFPSYVINLLDNLEDTFDTLSSPVRNVSSADGLAASMTQLLAFYSAPAELESLFHDVNYSYTPHSIALPQLSRQELAETTTCLTHRHFTQRETGKATHQASASSSLQTKISLYPVSPPSTTDLNSAPRRAAVKARTSYCSFHPLSLPLPPSDTLSRIPRPNTHLR